jgi:co-chaperonin GroES (HSP10)
MFPDLSKIFGRDFVIGYLLPAIIFVAVQIVLVLALFTNVEGLLRDNDMPAFVHAIGTSAPTTVSVEPLAGRILVATPGSKAASASTSPQTVSSNTKELVSGSVVAVGAGDSSSQRLKVGDTVYFELNAGAVLHFNNKEYRLVKAEEVISRVNVPAPGLPMPPTVSQLVSAKTILLLSITAWILAIAIMAINREIYRFVEGYGPFNPMWLIGRIERRRYRSLYEKWLALDGQDQLSAEDEDTYMSTSLKLVQEYPDREWLLPTRFGNVLRAFEVYSRVMYGLDAIPGWERLQLVCDKEVRESLEGQKSRVDFWLNVWVFAWVVTLEGLGATWLRGRYWWLLPAGVLPVTLFLLQRARAAAMVWGESVKAAIDLAMPVLREKLAFPPVKDRAEDRKMWEKFSQAILYRRPDALPAIAPPSEPTQKPSDSGSPTTPTDDNAEVLAKFWLVALASIVGAAGLLKIRDWMEGAAENGEG